MKKLFFILFLFPILCNAQLSQAQKTKVDSLKQVVKSAKHDSIVINALLAWDDIIYLSDPDL